MIGGGLLQKPPGTVAKPHTSIVVFLDAEEGITHTCFGNFTQQPRTTLEYSGISALLFARGLLPPVMAAAS